MKAELGIDGTRFLINGRPTYEGRTYRGASIEGLLFNSRMVQAIFDDECAATRELWRYPDTGRWDPERNTAEFCALLPEYHRYGLLAVTVGLQGGGAIYTPEVYDAYVNSAYEADGTLKPAYFDRLARVLAAADEAGMVVLVNYFYFKQATRLRDEETALRVTERVSEWLLKTGRRNVIVDVANEANAGWAQPIFHPENVHRLIEAARGVTVDGRRLLVGTSTIGGDALPAPRWLAAEDVTLPHGNGCTPEQLRAKLGRLTRMDEYAARPRPIVINEDSVFTDNMDAALREGASWGFYCQGYGSGYRDRMDWTARARESEYDELSGFQTVPVNWGINTPVKKRFFDHLKEITGGCE